MGDEQTRTPHEEMLRQLIERKVYLDNFDRIQSSEGGKERFIFFAEERFFDAWLEVQSGKISKVSWCEKDEFLKILEAMFPQQSFQAYTKKNRENRGRRCSPAPPSPVLRPDRHGFRPRRGRTRPRCGGTS